MYTHWSLWCSATKKYRSTYCYHDSFIIAIDHLVIILLSNNTTYSRTLESDLLSLMGPNGGHFYTMITGKGRAYVCTVPKGLI